MRRPATARQARATPSRCHARRSTRRSPALARTPRAVVPRRRRVPPRRRPAVGADRARAHAHARGPGTTWSPARDYLRPDPPPVRVNHLLTDPVRQALPWARLRARGARGRTVAAVERSQRHGRALARQLPVGAPLAVHLAPLPAGAQARDAGLGLRAAGVRRLLLLSLPARLFLRTDRERVRRGWSTPRPGGSSCACSIQHSAVTALLPTRAVVRRAPDPGRNAR